MNIYDLKPDKRNARRHDIRNLGMIETSLEEVGAARSIVVDEENNILAGNGTVKAAAAAGITNVQIVDTDGDTLIAVRRSGLTDEQKRRLAILDNRTAELAEWDAAILAELAQEGVRLDDLWSENELDIVLNTPPNVVFREFDESAVNDVKKLRCPECGHEFIP